MLTAHQAKRFIACTLLALGFSACSTTLFAQPAVTYTVSGSSGDFTLDFTLNNGSPGTEGMDAYFWGVYDANGTVSASPSSYVPVGGPFSPFGPIPYNNIWIDPTDSALPTGASLSGFDVLDTSATAPTSVPYFVYAESPGGSTLLYTGPGNVLGSAFDFNPLFEGNATTGVPDSGTTMSLLGLALASLAGVSRKLRKIQSRV
jgi:hypothetical protein